MSFKVTIPGLPSPLVDKYIVKVIVDQHTRLPSMFEVHILDEMLAMNYKYIDLPTVTIGTLACCQWPSRCRLSRARSPRSRRPSMNSAARS